MGLKSLFVHRITQKKKKKKKSTHVVPMTTTNNNDTTTTSSVGPPAHATTTTTTTTTMHHHQTNKNAALAARIKRVMQSDEEVGKIVKTTPLVVAKALELFLTKLFKATAEMALAHGARIIGPTP